MISKTNFYHCLLIGLFLGHITISKADELPITFETMDGQTTEAYEGTLWVPENRAKKDSRKIKITYVRFPATTKDPGPPIIYLAGGPGGSGISTAQYPNFRFPLFMALREHADVIALDQRGTGKSSDLPECPITQKFFDKTPINDDRFTRETQAVAKSCLAFWRGEGIDVEGYNTLENARDLNDLRLKLGTEKVTLWGISYGTHLALAALKVMKPHIDKLVLASAEGLDQTVKLPARTDAYFERLQIAVNNDPAAAASFKDITGLMRRVHKKLDQAPITLHVPSGDGGEINTFLFQRMHIQLLASGMISDPHRGVGHLLMLYQLLDQPVSDITEQTLIQVLHQAQLASGTRTFKLMSLTMDVASGISPERLTVVRQQSETSLLGDVLNFPMPQLAEQFPELDLGDEFRKGPMSNVKTLLLTGTLDGRTYPEGQREAVRGLTNVTQVIVENAGHNLFMSSPEVEQAIHAFLREEQVNNSIYVELPSFVSAMQ